MPSSRYDLIPTVLDIVTRLKPKSILDVGIGFGKYGVLFREYLDIWNTDKPYADRGTKIIGIEAFADEYRNPVWEVYDQILEGDIFSYGKMPEVDLLFLGDVIEHMTRRDGRELLRDLQYKYAIILTPITVTEQEDVYGNKFERHISQWKIEDFPDAQIHATVGNQQLIHFYKGK